MHEMHTNGSSIILPDFSVTGISNLLSLRLVGSQGEGAYERDGVGRDELTFAAAGDAIAARTPCEREGERQRLDGSGRRRRWDPSISDRREQPRIEAPSRGAAREKGEREGRKTSKLLANRDKEISFVK